MCGVFTSRVVWLQWDVFAFVAYNLTPHKEVKHSKAETTLFRGQDVAAEVMSAYATYMGRTYLQDVSGFG